MQHPRRGPVVAKVSAKVAEVRAIWALAAEDRRKNQFPVSGLVPRMPTQRYGVTSYDPLRVEQGSERVRYPILSQRAASPLSLLVPSARVAKVGLGRPRGPCGCSERPGALIRTQTHPVWKTAFFPAASPRSLPLIPSPGGSYGSSLYLQGPACLASSSGRLPCRSVEPPLSPQSSSA